MPFDSAQISVILGAKVAGSLESGGGKAELQSKEAVGFGEPVEVRQIFVPVETGEGDEGEQVAASVKKSTTPRFENRVEMKKSARYTNRSDRATVKTVQYLRTGRLSRALRRLHGEHLGDDFLG